MKALIPALLLAQVAVTPVLQDSGVDQVPAARDQTGDNPPGQFEVWVGRYAVAHDAAGVEFFTGNVDPLEISGIPPDATIVRAYFVTGDAFIDPAGDPRISLTFGGSSYGHVPAHDHDGWDDFPSGWWDLYSFWIDVSDEVTGDGSYSYAVDPPPPPVITNALQEFHLVVLYEHHSLPVRTIEILMGAEFLHGSSTAQFQEGGAGQATLHVFVNLGDAGNSIDEESIAFNGDVVLGGPLSNIFASTNGPSGTYFVQPVLAQADGNTVTVTSLSDLVGWYLAILDTPGRPISIESSSWGRVKGLYR